MNASYIFDLMLIYLNIFTIAGKSKEYGISAVVRQTLTLRETSNINDRIFDHSMYFLVQSKISDMFMFV